MGAPWTMFLGLVCLVGRGEGLVATTSSGRRLAFSGRRSFVVVGSQVDESAEAVVGSQVDASAEARRLKAEIEQLQLMKEVEELRREIKADEASMAEMFAEDRARREAEDARKEAARASKGASRTAARKAQRREQVLRQCVNQNATEVSLILLNDGVNKRQTVKEVLVAAALDDAAAESVMMRAHRQGAGVVGTYAADDLDGAYDTYCKLADAGLNVRFEAALGDGEADAAELLRIAELRDLGAQLKEYNINIMNDAETDLNFPTTVFLNGFFAIFAAITFSLAWSVGGTLGELAGTALGGTVPPGF